MEPATAKELVTSAPRPAANPMPPRTAAPVMDIQRPATAQPAAAEPNHEVHEAPAEDSTDKPSETPTPAAAVVHAKVPKQPKPRQPGVAGAIIATVVIVFGLAALAVYAYLKS